MFVAVSGMVAKEYGLVKSAIIWRKPVSIVATRYSSSKCGFADTTRYFEEIRLYNNSCLGARGVIGSLSLDILKQ